VASEPGAIPLVGETATVQIGDGDSKRWWAQHPSPWVPPGAQSGEVAILPASMSEKIATTVYGNIEVSFAVRLPVVPHQDVLNQAIPWLAQYVAWGFASLKQKAVEEARATVAMKNQGVL